MHFLLAGRPCLFIHVPKTGGNSVQQALLGRGLSQDALVTSGHQDGDDRFGLLGPYTTSKHQPLMAYEHLHPETACWPVYLSVREPLARLVSLYFSPHRWLRPKPNGSTYHYPEAITFDEGQFAQLLQSTPSAAGLLSEPQSAAKVQAMLTSGRLQLLRNETLAADFQRHFGFALPARRCNVSPFQAQARQVLASSCIAELVSNSHHQLDRELFYP